MKVVINALQYKPNSSGIGVMLRELFGQYSKITGRRCQIVLPKGSPDFPAGKSTELIYAPFEYEQGYKRMLFQSILMGRKHCCDALLLTTDSSTPFFMPKNSKLIPIVTDLAVYRMPEVYLRSRVLLWRFRYKYIRRRADLFLAISEFTKREMTDILKIPAGKIHVVPCACSEQMKRVEDSEKLAALREKYGLPEQFILFVGNTNPRKNLDRMIKAFDLMKSRTDTPCRLVIAGGQGWKFDRDRVLEGIEHRDDVLFTGFVPDEDMPALYSASALLAFVTLYEGFGIPVLEAQQCGVPVLTSNTSSLPEVGGDGALYVDPYDIEDICKGMQRILEDEELAQQLVMNGYENAKRFSWEKSAQLLDKIIEKEVMK